MNTDGNIPRLEGDARVVRHINPDGTTGGWVSMSAKIAPDAHIDFTSFVGPWAVIPPGSWIGAHSHIGLMPQSKG